MEAQFENPTSTHLKTFQILEWLQYPKVAEDKGTSETKSKQQRPGSNCMYQPATSWGNACSTCMHKPVRCMHWPVTSQADACTYCMGSKVSSLSQIYLYLQLLCLWTRSSITASCSLLFCGKNWRGKFCVSGNQIKVFVLPHYIRSSNNVSMQKQSVSILNSLDKLTSINMIFWEVFLFENLLHTCLFFNSSFILPLSIVLPFIFVFLFNC